jgi:hypothetical protein
LSGAQTTSPMLMAKTSGGARSRSSHAPVAEWSDLDAIDELQYVVRGEDGGDEGALTAWTEVVLIARRPEAGGNDHNDDDGAGQDQPRSFTKAERVEHRGE